MVYAVVVCNIRMSARYELEHRSEKEFIKKGREIIGSIHPWAFGVLVDFRILQSADRRWIRADGSSSKTGFIYHHGSQRHRTAMVYPDVMDFFGIARMGSQSGKR